MEDNAYVPNPAMRRSEVKRTARQMLKGNVAPLALGLLILFALTGVTSIIDHVVGVATNQVLPWGADPFTTVLPDASFGQNMIYSVFQLAISVFSIILTLGIFKMALDLTYGVKLNAPMVLSGFTHFWEAAKFSFAILWRVVLWTLAGVAVGMVGLVGGVVVAAGQASLNPAFDGALDAVALGDYSALGTIFGSVGAPLIFGFLFFMLAAMAFATYAQIRYSQAYYLYFYNPKAPAGSIIKQGVDLMKGHYWELFVYSLSFFWWWMLCIVTLGLAYFYVAPYYNVTWALYHRNLVEGWDRQHRPAEVPTDASGNPQYVTYVADPNVPVVPAAPAEPVVPMVPAVDQIDAPEAPSADELSFDPEESAESAGEETSGR